MINLFAIGLDWASAGASAFGSLIGGIFGDKNTRDTNAANLQIARENNQTSIDIAKANNDLQYKMFNEANEYNSPANQFKMMQEAGYNPYSLYSNPSSSAASSAPLPSLQQPNLVSPQMMPQTHFANSLQNFAVQSANVLKILSDAQKSKEETKTAEITNQTLGARLIEQLRAAGLENQARELENRFNSDTFDWRKNAVLQQNELNNILMVQGNQAIKQAAFDFQLQAAFGFKLKQKELDNLTSLIDLNNEKALTEAVQRYAIKKGVSQRDAEIAVQRIFAAIGQQNANTNQMVGTAQAGVFNQTAQSIKQQRTFDFYNQKYAATRSEFLRILMSKGYSREAVDIQSAVMNYGFTKTTLKTQRDLLLQKLKTGMATEDYIKTRRYVDVLNTTINVIDKLDKETSKDIPSSPYSPENFGFASSPWSPIYPQVGAGENTLPYQY